MSSQKQSAQNGSGSFLEKYQAMSGDVGGVDVTGIDPVVLYHAVVFMASNQASIQIGVTKDGNQWAVQLWDGKFPVKDYHSSTEKLNKALAALVRAGYGKRVDPDLEERLQSYGW